MFIAAKCTVTSRRSARASTSGITSKWSMREAANATTTRRVIANIPVAIQKSSALFRALRDAQTSSPAAIAECAPRIESATTFSRRDIPMTKLAVIAQGPTRASAPTACSMRPGPLAAFIDTSPSLSADRIGMRDSAIFLCGEIRNGGSWSISTADHTLKCSGMYYSISSNGRY